MPRQRYRRNDTDGTLSLVADAYPVSFSLTLDNNIKMKATLTRRAALEHFTFRQGWKPYFVIDLANDLPASFAGGTLQKTDISLLVVTGAPGNQAYPFGRRRGTYLRVSFGPRMYHHQSFACYDLLHNAVQKLSEYGIWTADE